jgi:hypothetical protein
MALSAATGGVLAVATGEVKLVPITFAAGVLPDVDHVFDYYNWYIRNKTERLFVFLHGWEYLAALVGLYLFAFQETWMLAITIGYATQIGTDQIFNHPKWHTYFVISRAARGFAWSGVVRRRPADESYMSLMASIPIFRGPIKAWFERRVGDPETAKGTRSEVDESGSHR